MINQLQKIKDIADEHFEDYVIIVMKNGQTWHTYKNKVSAHGACAMMMQGIQQDWFNNKQSVQEKNL